MRIRRRREAQPSRCSIFRARPERLHLMLSSIKFRVATALVVAFIGAIGIASMSRPPVGPITSGVWAGPGNWFCRPEAGLMKVEPHRFVFTNGTQTRSTPRIDLSGSESDPKIFLSTSRYAKTSDGWVLTAHIQDNRLTFVSLAPHFPNDSGKADLTRIQQSMMALQRNQPWRRCPPQKFPKGTSVTSK
jgi:hypothetical protein